MSRKLVSPHRGVNVMNAVKVPGRDLQTKQSESNRAFLAFLPIYKSLCSSTRTGWHDLPTELKWMVLHWFIVAVTQRIPNIEGWNRSSTDDYKRLHSLISRDELSAMWKELYNLIIAIPSEQDDIRQKLAQYTDKIWLLCEFGIGEDVRNNENPVAPSEDDIRRDQKCQAQLLNRLVLLKLLNMREERREHFWEGYNYLLVCRRAPFQFRILMEYRAQTNHAEGKRRINCVA